MAWKDKKEVKKGTLGEDFIKDIFRKKGYMLYNPEEGGPHVFDFIAVKDKIEFRIVEVKTKQKCHSYPATGFNVKHYEEYKTSLKILSSGLDLLLFFVDYHPDENRIYCSSLADLSEPFHEFCEKRNEGIDYPKYLKGDVVVFPLSRMRHVIKLTEEQIKLLNGIK